MSLPKDFKKFIELAISMNLKFVIVGGWAYNRYVEPRATGDIDFFVEKSPATEQLVRQLLTDFGFGSVLPGGSLFDKDVIMLGRAPYRIDILTTSINSNSNPTVRLRDREGEFLRQLANGISNQENDRMLGMSCEKAREYVKQILKKLNVERRMHAATCRSRNFAAVLAIAPR